MVYTEHVTGRTHAHFSRANTTAHHPHVSSVGRTTLDQREKSPRHLECFTSFSFLDVLLFVPYRPIPRVLSSPVRLAEWLTQLQTQVP